MTPDYTRDHDEPEYGKYLHPDGSLQDRPHEEKKEEEKEDNRVHCEAQLG